MKTITSYKELREAEKAVDAAKDQQVVTSLSFLLALRFNSNGRDDFARAAMQGMLSGNWPDSNERVEVARRSWAMADSMLQERGEGVQA